MLLFDLKHMDSDIHRQFTGAGNELILKNIIRTSRIVDDVIIRFPMIPGFNADPANIEAMGRFIAEKLENVRQIDILPYHSHGASKVDRIGSTYNYDPDLTVEPDKIEEARQILQSFGLKVSVGG
jgi:pyruvate formate lyase activating enzyme